MGQVLIKSICLDTQRKDSCSVVSCLYAVFPLVCNSIYSLHAMSHRCCEDCWAWSQPGFVPQYAIKVVCFLGLLTGTQTGLNMMHDSISNLQFLLILIESVFKCPWLVLKLLRWLLRLLGMDDADASKVLLALRDSCWAWVLLSEMELVSVGYLPQPLNLWWRSNIWWRGPP